MDNYFINELEIFCSKMDETFFAQKVVRIFNKAMIRGKIELAKKIEAKYRKSFSKIPKSDMAMSFAICLNAQKNNQ